MQINRNYSSHFPMCCVAYSTKYIYLSSPDNMMAHLFMIACLMVICLSGCSTFVQPASKNVTPQETISPEQIPDAPAQYLCNSDDDCVAREVDCSYTYRCFHKDQAVAARGNTPSGDCSATSLASGSFYFYRNYDLQCTCIDSYCKETSNSTLACEKLYKLSESGCVQSLGANTIAVWRGLLSFRCDRDVCNLSQIMCEKYRHCNFTFEQVLQKYSGASSP
jgi:hypothetical protein